MIRIRNECFDSKSMISGPKDNTLSVTAQDIIRKSQSPVPEQLSNNNHHNQYNNLPPTVAKNPYSEQKRKEQESELRSQLESRLVNMTRPTPRTSSVQNSNTAQVNPIFSTYQQHLQVVIPNNASTPPHQSNLLHASRHHQQAKSIDNSISSGLLPSITQKSTQEMKLHQYYPSKDQTELYVSEHLAASKVIEPPSITSFDSRKRSNNLLSMGSKHPSVFKRAEQHYQSLQMPSGLMAGMQSKHASVSRRALGRHNDNCSVDALIDENFARSRQQGDDVVNMYDRLRRSQNQSQIRSFSQMEPVGVVRNLQNGSLEDQSKDNTPNMQWMHSLRS